MTSPLSFRIHNTKIYEKTNYVISILNKIIGPENYNNFTINSKICETNNKIKYKTFYIHFKNFIVTEDNSNFVKKVLDLQIINIMHSFPNYWRCSIINSPTSLSQSQVKVAIPKPLPITIN